MATATPPVPLKRLKEIAAGVCERVFGDVEFYDHAKTGDWNDTVINSVLSAVVSEATTQSGSPTPTHKFACNSTIVQHLVPTAALNKPQPGGEPHISTSADAAPATVTRTTEAETAGATTPTSPRPPAIPTSADAAAATGAAVATTDAATATDGKPHVGRRGMHSAMGAYWDQEKDGMWTFKYDGDGKGLDIVIMLIWIAL